MRKETVPAQDFENNTQGQFDILQQHCSILSNMSRKAGAAKLVGGFEECKNFGGLRRIRVLERLGKFKKDAGSQRT